MGVRGRRRMARYRDETPWTRPGNVLLSHSYGCCGQSVSGMHPETTARVRLGCDGSAGSDRMHPISGQRHPHPHHA